MSFRVTIQDVSSVVDNPAYKQEVTISAGQLTSLVRLLELLRGADLNSTHDGIIDKLTTSLGSALLSGTNATALNTLLAAINAGTNVGTVVTAINAL